MWRYFLVAFLLFSSLGFSKSDADFSSVNKITVAISDANIPFHFIDEQGKPAGLIAEVWQLWQQRTGIEVEFVASNWSQTITNLDDKVVQVHGALAETAPRLEKYAFGQTLFAISTSVYIHKNIVGVSSFNDLTPYVVGVIKGGALKSYLLEQNPRIRVKEYITKDALLEGIVAGEVRAFVEMDYTAFQNRGFNKISEQFPPYKRIKLFDADVKFAVLKGQQELLTLINKGMALIDKKELAEIEQKWIGSVANKDALVIALSSDNEPYMGVSPSGEAIGLFVDLWREWAEVTQTDVEFVPNTMQLSLDALIQGKADIHMAYPESEAVKTGLPQGHHLYSVFSNLFVDSSLELSGDFAELKGHKIGLFNTAPYKMEFEQQYPNVIPVYFSGLDNMLNAAINNEISGFVAANQLVHRKLLQNSITDKFKEVEQVNYEAKIFSLVNTGNQGLKQKVARGFELIPIERLIHLENKWVDQQHGQFFQNSAFQFKLSDEQQRWLSMVPEVSVGVVHDWKPYEFVNDAGELVGINRDVFDLAERLTGQKYNFVVYQQWQQLLNDFKLGKLDMVANISATEKRRQFSHFTSSFWHSAWAVATDKSVDSFESIKTLFGKRVAVVQGYQVISDLHQQYPEVLLQVVESLEEGMSLLAKGEVDAVLDNMVVTAQFIQDNDLYQFRLHVMEDLPYDTSHMGIRIDLPMQAQIMDKVVHAISEQQRQEILNRWFKLDLVSGMSYTTYWRNLSITALFALLVITGILVWNRKLKREIRRRIVAEAKLQHVATHDGLTGLANRSLFKDRVTTAIAGHDRSDHKMAIMFIDLDGFKLVNDKYGHDIGDEFLTQVAGRLKQIVRESDTVARIGGDEFVVLVTHLQQYQQAAKVADKIISEFNKPVQLGNKSLKIGSSIGIACYPEDGNEHTELLNIADHLMYKVKNSGKNAYLFSEKVAESDKSQAN